MPYTTEDLAAAERRIQQPCPDCGHRLYEHPNEHFHKDGHTCTKCASNPGGLVGNPGGYRCCLTTAEVQRVIDAGAPSCPNHDDPVLCKWDQAIGALVPEAGCPLHDVALRSRKDPA